MLGLALEAEVDAYLAAGAKTVTSAEGRSWFAAAAPGPGRS